MPVVTSILFSLALVLAVLIGPQTREWSWGPSMILLALAAFSTLPVWLRERRRNESFVLLALGATVSLWFAIRGFTSPVRQFTHADMMLLGAAVGSFVCIRTIQSSTKACGVIAWTLALLLMASAAVAFKQVLSPGFTPIFRLRPDDTMVSGFFAHYNEAANYFLASSLLVAAAGLLGNHRMPVRILFLLCAAAGMASVYLTHSRGGILGAAVGSAVFGVLILIIGKQRRASWFLPALIGLPLLGAGLATYLLLGWQAAQERRNDGPGAASITRMFDNSSRLYFLGVAFSCIQQHPLAGGGSRSFSWECRQFLDAKTQGDTVTHRPEQVHNELMQAATDYGLIGGLLTLGLLTSFGIRAVVRLVVDDSSERKRVQSSWLIGGSAALVGMLIQSSFSFVFHLMPGAILLGLCLGYLACPRAGSAESPLAIPSKAIMLLAGLASGAMLAFFGYKGSRVTWILWDSYYGKTPAAPIETRIQNLETALRVWPLSELHHQTAILLQTLPPHESGDKPDPNLLESAVQSYLSAAEQDPTDPTFPINRANLLSKLERDDEAEQAYRLGIRLQGGMEPAFRGYFCMAGHLLRKGLRLSASGKPDDAHATLELAAEQIEEAEARSGGILQDLFDTRVAIHESLGMAREASGDLKGALQSYTLASSLYKGGHVYFRMGLLLGRMAEQAYFGRKPSEALMLYQKANRMANLSKQLPNGIGPAQRAEFNSVLLQRIQLLKTARIEPAPDPDTPGEPK